MLICTCLLTILLLFDSLFSDSLTHRASVAEMMFVLEPHKKEEAIKLIEESSDDLISQYAAIIFYQFQ